MQMKTIYLNLEPVLFKPKTNTTASTEGTCTYKYKKNRHSCDLHNCVAFYYGINESVFSGPTYPLNRILMDFCQC